MRLERAVAICLIAAAGPALVGCGESDSEKITAIVEAVGGDPVKGCENASERLLEGLGGEEACKRAAEADDGAGSDVEVRSVKVDGDRATAKLVTKNGDQTARFVRQDGDWKIDAVR